MRNRTLSTLDDDSNPGLHSEEPSLNLKCFCNRESTKFSNCRSQQRPECRQNGHGDAFLFESTARSDSNVNLRFPPELILEQMLRRERALNYSTKNESPFFISHRSDIITFVSDFCSKSEYKPTTRALAVRFIDEVLTLINFKSDETLLIVITCLILAVKFEESDTVRNGCYHVPPKQAIREYLNGKYSIDQLVYAESIIVSLLGYSLFRETVFSFANFLVSNESFSMDHLLCNAPSEATARTKFSAVVSNVCDLALSDYRFSFYKPSVLGIAAIMCGRRAIGIHSWPGELVNAVHAPVSDVSICFKNLWLSYYCSPRFKDFEFNAAVEVQTKIVPKKGQEKASDSSNDCLDATEVFDYNIALSQDCLIRSSHEFDRKDSLVDNLKTPS